MTRIFYTDGAPEPEQPPDHHDPPLGVACFPPVARVAQHQECAQHHDPPLGYDGIKDEEFSDEEWNNILRVACPECHYPFDGDGWVLCKEHRDETHP